MASPQESILTYTQPVQPPMPAAYYPARDMYGPYYEEESRGPCGLTLACGLLLLLLVIWFLYYMSPARVLTRRLIRAGWVLYVMPGCPHCVRQENILKGKFWKYVACKGGKVTGGYTHFPPVKCSDSAISGFPYWYNTQHPSRSKAGVQSWKDLEVMAK